MSRALRAARSALVIVASATALAGIAPTAQAQRAHPRSGVLVDPDARREASQPAAVSTSDPRFTGRRPMPRYPLGSNTGAPSMVYVLPGSGYGYPVGGYGSAPGTLGGAYDTNGRPLSVGADNAPAYDAVPSYTPDLSGIPYVVIEGGALMIDLPSGERRTFPSCAAQAAARDPDGHPRTIFYSGSSDGVVLRQGQRGRVQGSPSSASCYGLDAFGRVALL